MKHRINFAIEQELIDAAKEYAKQQYTSVTDLVRQYFLQLKRSVSLEILVNHHLELFNCHFLSAL